MQGLVVPTDGPVRRHASGLDARRFAVTAAVLERWGFLRAPAELYGASAGGLRVDDPGADLAVAAALASAAVRRPPPRDTAFVGEVSLTGTLRAGPGVAIRLAAARAAGIRHVVAPEGPSLDALTGTGVQVRAVRHLREALSWATATGGARRSPETTENGL
jgi:DNA repair protein RadA/Sms